MFINHGKIFLVFKIKDGLLFFQNPCSSEREKNIYIYIYSLNSLAPCGRIRLFFVFPKKVRQPAYTMEETN